MGNATSPASDSLAVGLPGKPGTPQAQNGQTSFVVSFNPGELLQYMSMYVV